MKSIIVIVGNNGSGKDTIADILCQYYNCKKYGISDILKNITTNEGNKNPTRQELIDINSQLVKTHNKDYILAELTLMQIQEDIAIIVGCRVPSQIDYLKRNSNCIVIGTHCDSTIRFLRIKNREYTQTVQEFTEAEQKENSFPNPQRTFDILTNQCDLNIINEGSKDDLQRQIISNILPIVSQRI